MGVSPAARYLVSGRVAGNRMALVRSLLIDASSCADLREEVLKAKGHQFCLSEMLQIRAPKAATSPPTGQNFGARGL